jgi:hypothetical protein
METAHKGVEWAAFPTGEKSDYRASLQVYLMGTKSMTEVQVVSFWRPRYGSGWVDAYRQPSSGVLLDPEEFPHIVFTEGRCSKGVAKEIDKGGVLARYLQRRR